MAIISGVRTPQVQIVKDGQVVMPIVNVKGMKTFTVQTRQRDGSDIFQLDGSVDGMNFPQALFTTGADGLGTSFTANISQIRVSKTSGSGVATDVVLQMSPF